MNDVTCERLTCECMTELNLYVYGLNRTPPIEFDQTTRTWVCPPGFVCTIDETETGCPTCGGPPPPVIIPTDPIDPDEGGECWSCLADDTDDANQEKEGFNRLRPTRTIANQSVTATCLSLPVPQNGSASYNIPAGTIRIPWPRNPNPIIDAQNKTILQNQVNAQALQLAIARLEIDIANGIQECEGDPPDVDPVPPNLLVDDDTTVATIDANFYVAAQVDQTISGSSTAGQYQVTYISGAINDNRNPCPTRRPTDPFFIPGTEVEHYKYFGAQFTVRSQDVDFFAGIETTEVDQFQQSNKCLPTLSDLESWLISQIGCDPINPSCTDPPFTVRILPWNEKGLNMATPPSMVFRTSASIVAPSDIIHFDEVSYEVKRIISWLRTWPGQLEITNWGTKAADFRPPGEASASVAAAWNGQFLTGYQNATTYVNGLGGYYTGNSWLGNHDPALQWFGYTATSVDSTLVNSLGGKGMFSPQIDWVRTGTEPVSVNGFAWYLTLFVEVPPGIKVPFWTGRKVTGTTPSGDYEFFDGLTSDYYNLQPAWGKLVDVVACTTVALPANTRTGNDLNADAAGALPAIDGVTLSVGQRVCVKNETPAANNGIYTVANAGSAVTAWELTRSTDFEPLTNPAIVQGKWFKVTSGASFVNRFIQLTTVDPITINTTPINFALIVDNLTVAAL